MSTPTSVQQQQPPIMATADVDVDFAAAASTGGLGNNNNNNSDNDNYPLQDVPNPHPHDVLCGRGGATNSHIGNSHWRTLVTANKELYVTLPKREKQLLSKSIVHAVRSQNPPGRFLQKDFGTGLWFDVGDIRALEKTSQALREGAPQLRDKLKVSPDNNNNINISSSGSFTEAQEATTTSTTPSSTTVVVLPVSVPLPVPDQGPAVADQRKNANHSSTAAPSLTLFENGNDNNNNIDNDNVTVPPPPSMLDPTGEFSFGTITIPDPSEVDGGLENGFSFGSVMSGVERAFPSSTTACMNDTVQIIGGPQQQQHHQQQNQHQQHHQHHSQPHHQQYSSRPVQRDSLAEAAGRLMPPTGLQANELSFGSIIMTDAEQSRLETNMQQQQQQQQQQYNNSSYAQPLYASTQRDNNHARFGRPTPGAAVGDDHVMGVQPVDGGLEPAGLSAGSMMSIGTIYTTNLENAGMSLGSMISTVDGGLAAIGTSFGSMTIGGGPNNSNTSSNNPPTAVVAEAPPLPPPTPPIMEAVPTFLRQKRSKGNLLECSDTESEDEEHSAQASAQKSAEWEKLKATFDARMAGGAYNSATVPPSFNPMAIRSTAARQHQTTTTNITAEQQQPLVLNIPETGFGRDLSQMSACSVGDYQDDHNPVANNNLILPFAAVAPLIGGQERGNDSGEMPPPYCLPPPPPPPPSRPSPPQGGGLTRTESDELRAFEVTLLNRGSSLASEDFEVPHQPE